MMKRMSPLVFAAALALSPALVSAPSHAASTVHTKWEQYKAGRALRHLSADGQRAFADMLQARDLLASGQTDAAIPALTDATQRLQAASTDNTKLVAAETALTPAPQHPTAPTHTPSAVQQVWIPVGGEFLETETLAPEKKAAVASANKQLKSGSPKQAAETMQVVDDKLDFIVALAPLAPTQGALNRAKVFTEGRDPQSALSALDQALNGVVFVADDLLDAQAAPAGAPAPAAKAPATP